MKFGYHTLRWGWREKLPFPGVLKDLQSVGFGGFEAWEARWRPYLKDGEKFLDILTEKGLELVSIYSFGSYIKGVDYSLLTTPYHLFWKWIRIPKILKFASSVGCERIIVGGGTPLKCTLREQNYQRMARLLNKTGRACSEHDVKLSYHPHPEPHPYTIQNRDQITKLFQLTDPDYVNFALDTGLGVGDIDLKEVIHNLGSRINHVHFKDFSRKRGTFVDLGEGDIDFPAVTDALRSIGYKGWIIIEDWYPPITPRSPLDSAKNSKNYVESHLMTDEDSF